ncbi:MAG TPA: DUF6229 family protein [Xanthomonadaceae bacterium]|jgi:hypothetical protein
MNDVNQGSDLVAQWRNGDSMSNPAGALFIGGQFAEADIISEIKGFSPNVCGTACTGSAKRQCC